MTAPSEEPRPTPLAGLAGDVTIVSLRLGADEAAVAALERLLSPAERDRAARCVPAVRRRFIAARGRLRQLLARALADDPVALEFAVGPRGKPALAGRHAGRCHFNLSHSQDRCLVAISERLPVGVDLELTTPDHNPAWATLLAPSVLTDDELEAHARLAEEARPTALLEAWVAKEAVLKATGEGIGGGLRRLGLPTPLPRATLLAAGPPRTVGLGAVSLEPWGVCLLETGGDGVAALACGRDSCRVSLVGFAGEGPPRRR